MYIYIYFYMIKFGIDRPRTLKDLYMTTVAVLAQAIIARALVAKPYIADVCTVACP